LEALKIEKTQTQEMLKASTKGYNEAVVATYELLRNLLAGKPQTQWDHCIVIEMNEHDSWAGPDSNTARYTRESALGATLHFLTV
jgi:hypothetical protein